MIIAVDGPTASGKGTIARALAAHYGLAYLDTGLLYRAVGRQVFLDGGDPDNGGDALAACSFPDSLLDDPQLRTEESGGLASRVSVHPSVRQALYERQRRFAEQPGGAVLDGRDIGTVIAPDADAKLFVTATVEARAERRWKEMHERGVDVSLDAIAEDIRQRDERDTGRKDAPLRVADGAFVIDNSAMSKDEALAAAIEAVETARAAAARPALTLREFDDTLAREFHDINAEWIAQMFTLEPTDRETLENPRAKVVDPGGAILFVEAAGIGIVGTCALQKTGPGAFELTKMGVRESARGLKAGEFLLAATLERARQLEADKLYLLTNRKCAAAIHLYEKLGFEHDAEIMAEYGARYSRCDVAMRYRGPGFA